MITSTNNKSIKKSITECPIHKAKRLFDSLPVEYQEIALQYMENKRLGKTLENKKILESLK